jgi:hypothetical protein
LCSPSLHGYMRLASYVPGELIPLVWLDPGITPCCKATKVQHFFLRMMPRPTTAVNMNACAKHFAKMRLAGNGIRLRFQVATSFGSRWVELLNIVFEC